ncbi:MAG: LON peptidase substrate-binding domain-containing protein [Verrucomicrobiales bacterium]|nr:LON peptidase substrate-binding domain-containing protein [Verrucomicrobiales bacterium]
MNLPKSVGVMILPSVNLFPQAILPLFIFEPRYRRMLRDALASHRMFCIAMQRPDSEEEAPSRVAGVGLIRASVENPDGTSNMILQGVARVSLGRVMRRRPYRVHAIQALLPESTDSARVDALSVKVKELVGERFKKGLPAPLKFLGEPASGGTGEAPSIDQVMRSLSEIADASVLADLVSCTLLSDPRQRQVMLETIDVETRLRYLIYFLLKEIEDGRSNPKDPGPE